MWFLWKFILRRLAKAQGFLDPMVVFSNLQYFSKPSEVWVPVELLRSGAVLQARGLINSQAIQNNLDWIWPFWVERQFNPNDKAFIPRAFSLTHINLTHRNWTAVGLPGLADFPLVDPAGLVTPLFDGWSVDAWIIQDKENLVPPRLNHVEQTLDVENTLAVLTLAQNEKFLLESRAEVKAKEYPVCSVTWTAQSAVKSWLMICVRPYNPEGISFIKDIGRNPNGEGWIVNKKEAVYLDKKPFQYVFANYHSGDLCAKACLPENQETSSISCKIGMATSAAIFPLEADKGTQVTVTIPLAKEGFGHLGRWSDHLQDVCELKVPDKNFEFLYNAAIKSIILHSPGTIYPGPFTYKRFWFRDAAFILQTMITVGLKRDIEKIIDGFLDRQTPAGYYKSQDGEWDSNGEALWIMRRFMNTMRMPPKSQWLASIARAAGWIDRKRRLSDHDPLHAGLMPAGFSAEHFGPNDFYYWDDFWSVAGLRAAASLLERDEPEKANHYRMQADDLLRCTEKSIVLAQQRLRHPGVPASPSRRMDAGSVGCLVASYPLQIWPAKDERMVETADFLMDKYFLLGAFYHEISHSGINIYLSLHIAQVLLRAGNPRFFNIVKSVADLATPTGQWPEAIHPHTRGGCMGDGEHMWASAEWVMVLRNMFVREEEAQRTLILCSGIPKTWLMRDETLFIGPVQTLYGAISLTIKVQETIEISWRADWHMEPPRIEIHLPGLEPMDVEPGTCCVKVSTNEALAHHD